MTITTLFIAWFFAGPSNAESKRPQLGVYLEEISAIKREGPYNRGIRIKGVVKDSGADKAGLREGDIIVELDGEKVAYIRDLVATIRETQPGDKVNLKILRDDTLEAITVEISEKKTAASIVFPRKWIQFAGDDRPRIGIQMQELTPQLAEYFDVESGVLITEVLDDSPAERAELRAGDIITDWEDQAISEIEDLYDELEDSNAGDKIAITVIRKGNKLKKTVKLAKSESQDDRYYGFFLEKDDTGDLRLRMGNRGAPPHVDLTLPEINIDLRNLRESMRSLMDGIGSYHEEMEELKDEMKELREELEALKVEKGV